MNQLSISIVAVVAVFCMIACGNADAKTASNDAKAIASESAGPSKSGKVKISGVIANAGEKQVFVQTIAKREPLASATTDAKGKFSIELEKPQMDFYRFYIEGQQAEAVLLVFDENQSKITINGDARDFPNTYEVGGSPDSQLLKELAVKKASFKIDMDSVKQMQMGLPANASPEIRRAMNLQDDQLKRKFEDAIRLWAVDNAGSLAAIPMLESTDLSKSVKEYQIVRDRLGSVIPNSPYLANMDKNLVAIKNAPKGGAAAPSAIQVGQPAPEISQASPEGETISLSSMKGKYVLIDFWASWCGPCRRENPNVKNLYDQYGGEQFEILSVSLDNNKARWEGAIKQDKMNWLHVSDLKKWQSAAASDYGVKSIPFTVLVDPEGKIIATKLRGPALANKLKELFG